jgi:hypothetical protein
VAAVPRRDQHPRPCSGSSAPASGSPQDGCEGYVSPPWGGRSQDHQAGPGAARPGPPPASPQARPALRTLPPGPGTWRGGGLPRQLRRSAHSHPADSGHLRGVRTHPTHGPRTDDRTLRVPDAARGHRGPVQHLEHCLLALFQQPQLHEHGRPPWTAGRRRPPAKGREELSSRTLGFRVGTRASVAQEPNLRPGSVVYLPEPMCKACTELARDHRNLSRDFATF